MRTRLRTGVAFATVALLLGAVSACSFGTDTPAPVTTEKEERSSGSSVADLEKLYLADGPPAREVLASGEGFFYGYQNGKQGEVAEIPATLRVHEVTAGPASTHVRVSVVAEQASDVRAINYASKFGLRESALEISAPQQDLKLLRSTWRSDNGLYSMCACASLPQRFTPEPMELSGIFPALPEETTEIEVSYPGFDPVTAPVTRK
ncbi:hypothetical protein [Kineosporia babensis]|uniref:Lipoprotein n=1 Tax=Kineosporia babensis TaxID=499548 RepID=A0A9X1N9H0_9ACTN|nr:hypothetical protein [Kineosporia babensis]MCD5309734.1 hypothetical protein [Kineosporia babensis]